MQYGQNNPPLGQRVLTCFVHAKLIIKGYVVLAANERGREMRLLISFALKSFMFSHPFTTSSERDAPNGVSELVDCAH